MSKNVFRALFAILLVSLSVTVSGCFLLKPVNGEKPIVPPDESSGIEDSIFDNDDTSDSKENETSDETNQKDDNATDVGPSTGSGNVISGNQQGTGNNGTPTSSPATSPTAKPSSSPQDTSVSEMDYESFTALSPSEQQAYMNSFEDLDAFFDWYNAAKDKYEEENPSIEIDGGVVDLNQIVNGSK